MLDAFIIDAIRREEARKEQAREQRIHLEVPELPRRRPPEEVPEMGDPIVIPLYRDEDDAEDTAA